MGYIEVIVGSQPVTVTWFKDVFSIIKNKMTQTEIKSKYSVISLTIFTKNEIHAFETNRDITC
jgi:hypothetical protein